MSTIQLQITDAEREELGKRAHELGVPVEALVKNSIDNLLNASPMSIDEAIKYTIEKNVELYKRLA
jgi:hypothetical protein